jgi:hypothetical protein
MLQKIEKFENVEKFENISFDRLTLECLNRTKCKYSMVKSKVIILGVGGWMVSDFLLEYQK